MGTSEIYSLGDFQIYNTVLLAVITMLYVTSAWLIYLITGSLYLLLPLSSLATEASYGDNLNIITQNENSSGILVENGARTQMGTSGIFKTLTLNVEEIKYPNEKDLLNGLNGKDQQGLCSQFSLGFSIISWELE